METILNVLTSTGIGVIGILFFTIWRARKYFIKNTTDKFSIKLLISRNIGAWVWSLMIIVLTAILTIAIPETAEGIATFTGLELITNKAGFFTFGLGLSATIKK